jgi:2-polyprenyl-3-methyl-5-hydroxy-6-metoxy-1,4-benzoquinol methylase
MSINHEHKCPICSDGTYSYFSHKDLFNNDVEIRKCINCGHGSYLNIWNESHFRQVYGAEYAIDYLNSTDTHSQRREQYLLDLALLEGFLPKEINVLDFGCSSGEYLDSMPEGWEKSGYEVNPELVKILETTHPNYAIYNNESDIQGNFDLVTLRGVIEHIPDHASLIELLNNQLRVGGFLYVSATPDFSSPCAVQYKSCWGQIVTPEHIHQFTPASLQILLYKSGLVMKALYHPYIGTPYENWKTDSQDFLSNKEITDRATTNQEKPKISKHPFPGNMMSVIFEKIR